MRRFLGINRRDGGGDRDALNRNERVRDKTFNLLRDLIRSFNKIIIWTVRS